MKPSPYIFQKWKDLIDQYSGISSKKSDYPPMFVDNEYIEDNKKKADAFNILF
jgi:hypothetical protein